MMETKIIIKTEKLFKEAQRKLDSRRFHWWLCFAYGALRINATDGQYEAMKRYIATLKKGGEKDEHS